MHNASQLLSVHFEKLTKIEKHTLRLEIEIKPKLEGFCQLFHLFLMRRKKNSKSKCAFRVPFTPSGAATGRHFYLFEFRAISKKRENPNHSRNHIEGKNWVYCVHKLPAASKYNVHSVTPAASSSVQNVLFRGKPSRVGARGGIIATRHGTTRIRLVVAKM